MKLKLWHVTQLLGSTLWPKFEANRLTPISGPAPLSQAQALKELAHVPYGETPPVVALAENTSVTEEPYKLGKGFYEVEGVLEWCLNKDTHAGAKPPLK